MQQKIQSLEASQQEEPAEGKKVERRKLKKQLFSIKTAASYIKLKVGKWSGLSYINFLEWRLIDADRLLTRSENLFVDATELKSY